MDTSALEKKFLDLLTQGSTEQLNAMCGKLLEVNRETALAFFDGFVERIVSRNRLKFLEALMEDGGIDLIPIFIKALREEKNVLYAKSMLFLYGYFEQSEALLALQAIEEHIHFDLVKPYQKVCSNMKSKFRELFYIEEVSMGQKNPKRMNHAARKMIEEPHPAYRPFLEKATASGDDYIQRVAIKTLAELGDDQSLEVILSLLPTLVEQHRRIEDLHAFLTDEETYHHGKPSWMAARLAEIVGWSEEDAKKAANWMLEQRPIEILDMMTRDLFPLDVPTRKDIYGFLEMVFAGKKPQETHIKRVDRLFTDHIESVESKLQSVFMTLGRLGDRLEVTKLHERVREEIPAGTRLAESLMITFMGGFQSDDSLRELLESLDPDQAHDLNEKILTSLEKYKLTEIPERLRALTLSPEAGPLRKHALRIIAESHLLDEIIDDLLDHPTVSVRTEAFGIIADYKHQHGYERLLELFNPDLSPRILEMLIEAMEAFPDTRTGEVLRPYLLPPHSLTLRNAALKSMYLAGGPDRMAYIVGAVEEYAPNKRAEMISSFLHVHETEKCQIELLEYPSFWSHLLEEPRNNIRMRAITLLEAADWTSCRKEAWPGVFQAALDNDAVKRDSREQRSLRVLMLKARNALTKRQEDEAAARAVEVEAAQHEEMSKTHRQLTRLLDMAESQTIAESTKGFRLLNLHLKPDWIEKGHPLTERLTENLVRLFEDHAGNDAMVKIGIKLSALIGDTRLNDKIRAILTQGNPELIEVARKVFSGGDGGERHHKVSSILILDDTNLITKTLTRQLERNGFQTRGAVTPSDAFDVLEGHRYDLLILDYIMPGSNGLDFLQKARARNIAPQHVIWITSTRDNEDLEHMRSVPSAGILQKPFPIDELLDRIQNIRVA